MSTCNFTQFDESVLYVLEDFNSADEDEAETENEWLYTSTKENIISDMENKYNISKTEHYYRDSELLGTIYINNDVYIDLLATSGYYSDVSFGYKVENNAEKQTKTLDLKIKRVCNYIEKIYKQHTTRIKRIATFSNGEAIYKAVK